MSHTRYCMINTINSISEIYKNATFRYLFLQIFSDFINRCSVSFSAFPVIQYTPTPRSAGVTQHSSPCWCYPSFKWIISGCRAPFCTVGKGDTWPAALIRRQIRDYGSSVFTSLKNPNIKPIRDFLSSFPFHLHIPARVPSMQSLEGKTHRGRQWRTCHVCLTKWKK